MMEVSDQDEWTDLYYGHASMDDDAQEGDGATVPIAKAMPQPLAQQVAGDKAMEKAMKIHEEQIGNSSRVSTSMDPPMIGILTERNYFLSSVPVCNYFAIMYLGYQMLWMITDGTCWCKEQAQKDWLCRIVTVFPSTPHGRRSRRTTTSSEVISQVAEPPGEVPNRTS